jgi:hypothetical protein
MSTGAVFKLIANDGKADRMLMATKLLNQRIKDVMCARAAAGKADVTPTLVDLERTHVLYMNAHFKPFAAIGYEYNKVRAQSGNAALGAGVTFSIPQFGDFFHDMVCRVRLSSFSAKPQLTPLQGSAAFPVNVPATSTAAGRYYNLVDLFGNVIVPGTAAGGAATGQVSYSNLVVYCDFPGNRLFRQVRFDVNGNGLDAYDEIVPMMLEKFCIPNGKRAGYDRLVGQENEVTGRGRHFQASVIDQADTGTPAGVIARNNVGQSNQTVQVCTAGQLAGASGAPGAPGTSAAATILAGGLINLNTAAPTATAPWGHFVPQYDSVRVNLKFTNGPQTAKPVQPALEIWNKLCFWFNDDVRLSIPSVSIPFGQRFISIELATAAELVSDSHPATLWLESIVDNGLAAPQNTSAALATSNPAGPFGPAAGSGTFGIQNGAYAMRTKSYTPIFSSAGINAPTIEAIELYINNIFVNPEIHDIYIKRIGFSLIRVYRQQRHRTTQGEGSMLLSQIKWPIEYMFVGARPTWNISPLNYRACTDWYHLTRRIRANMYNPDRAEAPIGAGDAASISSGIAPAGSIIDRPDPEHFYIPVSAVDSLALTSHGITIFDSASDVFYSSYMPFHYGGSALNTPGDTGALFINMALMPRAYQPSGHLNVSRARETYIKWRSTYISLTSPADFLVVAVAINFLLITDGSAVLRYAT